MPEEEDEWPRDGAAIDEDGVKVESPGISARRATTTRGASTVTATERATMATGSTMTTMHSNKSSGVDIRGKGESIVTLFDTQKQGFQCIVSNRSITGLCRSNSCLIFRTYLAHNNSN